MNSRSYMNKHEGHTHFLKPSDISKYKTSIDSVGATGRLLSAARALTDPTKLKIFITLNRLSEVSVNDISEIIDISQSAVSHALSDLKKLGIVRSNRCGKLICYSLEDTTDNKRLAEYANNVLT